MSALKIALFYGNSTVVCGNCDNKFRALSGSGIDLYLPLVGIADGFDQSQSQTVALIVTAGIAAVEAFKNPGEIEEMLSV